MILFFTSSLNISTDVPCTRGFPFAPPAAAAIPSLWSDCTSHSRLMVAVVGVVTDEYGRPAVFGIALTGKDEGGGPPPLPPVLDLKPERRFWADDLRRIAGRGASMGAMDMAVLTGAGASVRGVCGRPLRWSKFKMGLLNPTDGQLAARLPVTYPLRSG